MRRSPINHKESLVYFSTFVIAFVLWLCHLCVCFHIFFKASTHIFVIFSIGRAPNVEVSGMSFVFPGWGGGLGW
jgi:hypothetical protein